MDEPIMGNWIADLAGVLAQTLSTDAETDRAGAGVANVVDGLFAIARAVENVGIALQRIALIEEKLHG